MGFANDVIIELFRLKKVQVIRANQKPENRSNSNNNVNYNVKNDVHNNVINDYNNEYQIILFQDMIILKET